MPLGSAVAIVNEADEEVTGLKEMTCGCRNQWKNLRCAYLAYNNFLGHH